MYKIGIDLSTRNTGIAILKNNILVDCFSVELPKYGFEMSTNSQVHRAFARLANYIHKLTGDNEISFYVEIANFTDNGTLGVKFGRYLGILETYILCAWKWEHIKEIKTFNANEWFNLLMGKSELSAKRKLIGDRCLLPINQLTRTERKKLSMGLIIAPSSKITTDDVADAYWIAFYGDKCNQMK